MKFNRCSVIVSQYPALLRFAGAFSEASCYESLLDRIELRGRVFVRCMVVDRNGGQPCIYVALLS